MKIYKNFDIYDNNKRTITIGNFDGFHIAHKALVEKTISISQEEDNISTLLTFETHTSNLFLDKVKYICSQKQKLELFQSSNIQEVFFIDFNENIKSMNAKDFIKNILIEKLNVKNLVLGDDALLGSDRLNINEIKKICYDLGIRPHFLKQIEIDKKRVTSSLIRNMISNAVVGEELAKYLGRDYILQGEVVHGNNFGKTLGFPTANISVDKKLLIPKYGIYYGICEIENELYHSGINIGIKPSVENNYFSIEAFLINFNKNIYGENIKINLKKYLREEIKFDNIQDLKNQIQLDIKYIKDTFILK